MANDHLKPNPRLRKEILQDDVIIIADKELRRKHTVTLKAMEAYYEKWLETVCGKQIWAILDTLATVESEIASRRQGKKSGE